LIIKKTAIGLVDDFTDRLCLKILCCHHELKLYLFIIQLEIDFNAMHPDKSMALYAQWPKLSAFFLKKNSVSLTTEINDAFTPGKNLL